MYTRIYFEDFIATKKILHCNYATDYNEALNFLIKHDADVVTYNHTTEILVEKLEPYGVYYKYEFNCSKMFEHAVDNIHVESLNNNSKPVVTNYIAGCTLYPLDKSNVYLFVSAKYHAFYILISFAEKPNSTDKIVLTQRYYIFNAKDKKNLENFPVYTKSQIYISGMTGAISEANKNLLHTNWCANNLLHTNWCK